MREVCVCVRGWAGVRAHFLSVHEGLTTDILACGRGGGGGGLPGL